jgi:hypothetical protein
MVALMPDEEFKVEVELGDEVHHLSFWERLKSLDVDGEARKRLGSQATVTRDGKWIQIYTRSLDDAREAERTARELVAADDITAEYTVSRWDADKQEWVDPTDGDAVEDDAPETAAPDPSYVILEAYKPEFLRDLGF